MNSHQDLKIRLLEDRIATLEHQALQHQALQQEVRQLREQVAELEASNAKLKQVSRTSRKHRNMIEAAVWGVVGFVLILGIGYQSENWDIDATQLEAIAGIVTFVVMGKKAADAYKD